MLKAGTAYPSDGLFSMFLLEIIYRAPVSYWSPDENEVIGITFFESKQQQKRRCMSNIIKITYKK
ncbi:hypothetical protein DMI70_10480 [Escherichia coli]|nr:hypothetical protein [Escherichia coli]